MRLVILMLLAAINSNQNYRDYMPEQKQTDIQNRNSFKQSVVIGGLAGGIDASLTHPFMTLKTLWQVGTPLKLNQYYSSGQNFANKLEKTKKLVELLFRGVNANVTGMSVITAVRISIYDGIINYAFKTNHPTFYQHTISSSLAGALSALLTAPMELGVSLQQMTDFDKRPKNLIQIYSNIFRTHGIKQGLTGLTCVALRDSFVTSGVLTFSPQLKIILIKNSNMNENFASILSGSLMGVFCAILTHPLDTTKVEQGRILNSNVKNMSKIAKLGFWNNLNQKSDYDVLPVVKKIYQTSGVRGFYRGLWWRVARVAPHVGIVSVAAEKLTEFWNKTFVR